MKGFRLIQMGGRRVAVGLNHLRPKRVRYGFVRRSGGITAQTDGQEKDGARVESFTAQTGPILHKFQGPARLRHHFVPVFLQGILSNSTKKVSKSISFDVFLNAFHCIRVWYFILFHLN